MSDAWWTTIVGSTLAQGDLLPDCLMPVFTGASADEPDMIVVETINRARLIVVTQSCDLENNKVEFVALCPIHTLEEFEHTNPEFSRTGRWEAVARDESRASICFRLQRPPMTIGRRSLWTSGTLSACHFRTSTITRLPSAIVGDFSHRSWNISHKPLPASSCV